MGKITTDNYNTVNGNEIRLSIKQSDSAVEISIENLSYTRTRNRKIQNVLLHLAGYGILSATVLPQIWFVNIIFVSLIILQINSLMNIVNIGECQRERWRRSSECAIIYSFYFLDKLEFIEDSCLQIRTEYFLWRKKHLYLPIDNIYDVLINEVIYGVRATADSRSQSDNILVFVSVSRHLRIDYLYQKYKK